MQYIYNNNLSHLTTFAANYDCNTYGAGTYNETNCGTTTDPSTDTPTNPIGGGLADTGYNIIIPVALGLALIIAGIILLVKRLARRKK